MTTASTEDALYETKSMIVTITGEGPEGFTYTTSPETVVYRSKKLPTKLECTIAKGPVQGNFVFSGYNYPVANVQVDAKNMGTNDMVLSFQFNGQKTGGSLLFYIIDDMGRSVVVDPQVGNDPEPGV